MGRVDNTVPARHPRTRGGVGHDADAIRLLLDERYVVAFWVRDPRERRRSRPHIEGLAYDVANKLVGLLHGVS